MIGQSSVLSMYLLSVVAATAAGAGLTAGWLMASAFRHRFTSDAHFAADAALGCCGFLIVFVVSSALPMPPNVVTSAPVAGVREVSKMNYFQHPLELGSLCGLAVPVAFEVWRHKAGSSKLGSA